MTRVSWDEYFCKMAVTVRMRSSCIRRQVGAVLARDRQVLSTGYNGPPKGMDHCLELGCLRTEQKIPSGKRLDLCRAVHAEANAVVQAAFNGVSTKDADLYCTNRPCAHCLKLLINAGVRRVYFIADYADPIASQLLGQNPGIELVHLPEFGGLLT